MRICGNTWRITRDATDNEGSFDGHTRTININPELIGEGYDAALLHEVLEIILADSGLRYFGIDDSILFSFNHVEFIRVCMELSACLREMKCLQRE